MILIDANLLLYASIADYPQHTQALPWLEERFNGSVKVGLPWQTLTAFLRISTNPRLFSSPLSTTDAWAQLEEWLALPNVWIPVPTERHAAIFAELIRSSDVSGNLISDAHLAALAIEHGLELASSDGDFARFDRLNWRNPLKGKA